MTVSLVLRQTIPNRRFEVDTAMTGNADKTAALGLTRFV
jgi:hypothetical protein